MNPRGRLLGEPKPLHDVRDPEAHVRVLLDSRLAGWGAVLDSEAYEDALAFLLQTMWELSGLDANGAARLAFYVGVYVDELEVEASSDDPRERLGPFTSSERAYEVAVAQIERGFIVDLLAWPAPGSYDPERGLSFSTYSRRTLAARVVDWYRHTFGDSRYGGRRNEVSLNALAFANGEPVEEFMDTLVAPRGDETEEVLTRVALAAVPR